MREYEGYEDIYIGIHNIAPEIQAGKSAKEWQEEAFRQPTTEEITQREKRKKEIFCNGNAELKKALQA